MRLLRSALFAMLCARAVIYFLVPLGAQSQTFTVTTADKAAYQQFVKTCAAEIAAMKKFLVSANEPITDAQLREFLEPMPAQLREVAREEKLSFAAALKESRSRMNKEANDPNNTDKSAKVLQPTLNCFLDLLSRGLTGQGSSPGAAPAFPAKPADPDAAPIEGCVKIDEQPAGWVGFKNVCDFPVSFTYCADTPKKGSASEAVDCATQKFAVDSIAARGARRAPINDADGAFWYACRSPRMPIGSTFDGTDLTGTCK